jgi:hypothetical protein
VRAHARAADEVRVAVDGEDVLRARAAQELRDRALGEGDVRPIVVALV